MKHYLPVRTKNGFAHTLDLIIEALKTVVLLKDPLFDNDSVLWH